MIHYRLDLQQNIIIRKTVLLSFCTMGGDCEEGVALSLIVPSTSPPAHAMSGGMMRESATPPPSPSLSGVHG